MTEKHPTSPQTDPKEQRRHNYMRSDKRQDHGATQSRHGHEEIRRATHQWIRAAVAYEKSRQRASREAHEHRSAAWEINDTRDEDGRIKTQWDDELDFMRPPVRTVEVPLADWERELLAAFPSRSDSTPDLIEDVTANVPRRLYTSDADSYENGWTVDPDTVSQSVLNDMDGEEAIDDGWRASGDPYPWGKYENEDDIWSLDDDPVVWPEVDEYDDDDYEPMSEDQAAWLRDTGELTRAFSGSANRLGHDAVWLTNKMYEGWPDPDADFPDWIDGYHIVK